MNPQTAAQEQRDANLHIVPATVIPERLLKKLKRIPRLKELEKMFEEPTTNEYSSTQLPSILNAIPITRAARLAYTLRKPPGYNRHREMPPVRQRPTPSHTVTSSSLGQHNNSSADSEHESGDDDDEEDADDEDGNDEGDNEDGNDEGDNEDGNDEGDNEDDDDEGDNEDGTASQESNTPTETPSSTVNMSTATMEQILKRALFSLKHINNENAANPTASSQTQAGDVPPVKVKRIGPQKILITHGKSQTKVRMENLNPTSINTQGGRHQINYQRTSNASTTITRSLNAQNEKYKIQHFDRITCDVFKDKTRSFSKPNGLMYICNIAFLNHIQPKQKSKAVQVTTRNTIPLKSTASPKSRSKFGECPICMDKLSPSNLRSAYCGHLFCLRCIRHIYVKGDRKCPTCRCWLERCGYHKLYL